MSKGRHRRGITVAQLNKRLKRERYFVRPIRQVIFDPGNPIGRLEQIDIYGRHLNLGPIVMRK